MNYTVNFDPELNVISVLRSDGNFVAWDDPSFQAWNAVQPTPAVLSPVQLSLIAVRTMSYATFAGLSAIQKDKALFYLCKKAAQNAIF